MQIEFLCDYTYQTTVFRTNFMIQCELRKFTLEFLEKGKRSMCYPFKYYFHRRATDLLNYGFVLRGRVIAPSLLSYTVSSKAIKWGYKQITGVLICMGLKVSCLQRWFNKSSSQTLLGDIETCENFCRPFCDLRRRQRLGEHSYRKCVCVQVFPLRRDR